MRLEDRRTTIREYLGGIQGDTGGHTELLGRASKRVCFTNYVTRSMALHNTFIDITFVQGTYATISRPGNALLFYIKSPIKVTPVGFFKRHGDVFF